MANKHHTDDAEALANDLSALYAEESELFQNLAVAAGLDPRTDFRHRDLRALRFAGADLRGFDFSGSDLRGTGLRLADRIDIRTKFSDALIDPEDRNWLELAQSQQLVPPDVEKQAEQLILRGEPPPVGWRHQIRTLTLAGNNTFANLRLLAGLTNLEVLDLAGTAVDDLVPIAELLSLRRLRVSGMYAENSRTEETWRSFVYTDNYTQSRFAPSRLWDLGPISGLVNLEMLYLGGTEVSNLVPLEQMVRLRCLDIGGTRVRELRPIAGLTLLERLFLRRTDIVDINPLSRLVNLEILDLNRTKVADLAPLSGLVNLQVLELGHTTVTDLSPLFNLGKLRQIDLYNTPTSNAERLQKRNPGLRVTGDRHSNWIGGPRD